MTPIPAARSVTTTVPAIVRQIASAAGAPVPSSTTTLIHFERFRLSNGLLVLLAPDHTAPVIAVNVTYNVGSRDEVPGKTGMAHLLEHLMFSGSENVGKGEHNLLVSSVGGIANASTTADRTSYFEAFPSNQLKLALFLEADRMRSLDLTRANADNQRLVVEEERAQMSDNRGSGSAMESLASLAYSQFAYRHDVMGTPADLDAITLSDLQTFYGTYYAPNNAVLSIVGDFDTDAAKRLISRYFVGIPARTAPPPVAVDTAPRSGTDEKRLVLPDARARQPQFLFGFLTVPGNHPDYFPLRLLTSILATRSRSMPGPGFYMASLPESRGPALFTITYFPSPDTADTATITEAEASLDTEWSRLANGGITSADLDRALTRERVDFAGRYATNLARANGLSQYAILFDDPDRVNTFLDACTAVTLEQIQDVIRKYLTKANRSTVMVLPARANGFAQ